MNVYNIYQLNCNKTIFFKSFPKDCNIVLQHSTAQKTVPVFAFQASFSPRLWAVAPGTYLSLTLLLQEGKHLRFSFVFVFLFLASLVLSGAAGHCLKKPTNLRADFSIIFSTSKLASFFRSQSQILQ